MSQMQQNRHSMQCPQFYDSVSKSDQQRGVPHPPHGKTITDALITLPPFEDILINKSYMDLLDTRRSERVYAQAPLTQEQLAFILWSAQGVQSYRGANNIATLRPVPSGGARHPFELYITVQQVEGLSSGLYHYTPMEQVGKKSVAIEFLGALDPYESRVTELLVGQTWAAKASVVLLVSCVPYRAEWRYQEAAHRVMLIDLGHLGQNVMLSATALGLGSCCIAAYDQHLCDEALGADGIDEYTVYAISIGVPKE